MLKTLQRHFSTPSKKGGLFLLRAGQVEPLKERTSSSEGNAIESNPYLRLVKCNYSEYRREYKGESGAKSRLPESKKETRD